MEWPTSAIGLRDAAGEESLVHKRRTVFDSTRCVVYGVPNAAARAFLDRLGATQQPP